MCAFVAAWCASDGSAQNASPNAPNNSAQTSGATNTLHVDPEARALFLTNCAPCHGESGDGQGTTKLERPARSFKAGGFSYGNTPETLLRTITNGIPGTQMPSFASALKIEQRRALAQYVIALGPEQIAVEAKDTVMVVRDKPLIARGKLPPIVDGAPERPRGLLVGLPDGLTFEYRTDDVRLLGVRSGDFVERKDWTGRGGDPLQPLGQLVRASRAGNPPSMFMSVSGYKDVVRENSVVAQLISTRALAGVVSITYDLIPEGDRANGSIARITETPSAYACKLGMGWRQVIQIEGVGDAAAIALRPVRSVEAGHGATSVGPDRGACVDIVGETSFCDVIAFSVPDQDAQRLSPDYAKFGVRTRLRKGEKVTVTLIHVPGIAQPPNAKSPGGSLPREFIDAVFTEVR